MAQAGWAAQQMAVKHLTQEAISPSLAGKEATTNSGRCCSEYVCVHKTAALLLFHVGRRVILECACCCLCVGASGMCARLSSKGLSWQELFATKKPGPSVYRGSCMTWFVLVTCGGESSTCVQ